MNVSLRIGELQLIERLASGSVGEVWRAQHATHRYPLALKILAGHAGSPGPPDAPSPEELRREFQFDINTLSSLSHPHIVSVYDFSSDPPILAMELAEGSCRQLDDIASWPELKRLLLHTLSALEYLHKKKIVHCDIKPDNILRFSAPPPSPKRRAERVYKLTDFGIAHHIGAAPCPHSRTLSDTYRGSPQYSPPEQILGDLGRYGPWTDLYALGCTAFEYACGSPPFGRANFMTLTMRHLDDAPQELIPRFRIPSGFKRWVSRLLAKPCDARFQSAAAAAEILSRLDIPPSIARDRPSQNPN